MAVNITPDITDPNAVYEAFFDKLEQDDEFFAYYGIDEDHAMQLAKERAQTYLRSAIAELGRRTAIDFDLSLVQDEETGETVFAEPITDAEVDVLSELMLLKYYERGLAKLRPKINAFSASELRLLHSPANERISYVTMLKDFREHIRVVVSRYAGRSRNDFKRRLVDTTIPDTVDDE